MGKVGDLCEIKGEIKFKWDIKGFSQLLEEIDIRYESPKFYFSGTCWEIRIYPNGQKKIQTDGWLSIFLAKISNGLPVTVDYSFSLKSNDGKTDLCESATGCYFDKNNMSWGCVKFVQKSALLQEKSRLLPFDTLTLICNLKNSEANDVSGSYFGRLQEMSDNFKEVYLLAKGTDFTLKVGEEKVYAHRMVLKSRSPVFSAMLSHDTTENISGEVTIPDMDKRTMETILIHMYSADLNELTTENALLVYDAADKYDVKDIKEICSKFIMMNLSVEWVCDVIKFAELYQEEEISRCAKEFFKGNASEILETDKWKNFAKENHDIGVELLSTVVKTLLQK